MPKSDIKSSLREGVVERSVKIMRNHGISDEKIKEKMIESFSLDEETINNIITELNQAKGVR